MISRVEDIKFQLDSLKRELERIQDVCNHSGYSQNTFVKTSRSTSFSSRVEEVKCSNCDKLLAKYVNSYQIEI